MKRTWAPPLSTMMKVERRDDAAATYYTIDKGDRSFATMLGLNMSVRSPCENVPIISYLVDRRNAATEEAMAKVVIEDEDPNAAEQGAPMDIASIKGKKTNDVRYTEGTHNPHTRVRANTSACVECVTIVVERLAPRCSSRMREVVGNCNV